jgi:cytoskeletal protein RodZ
MNKLSQTGKWIIIAVVIVGAIILIVAFGNSAPNATAPPVASNSSTTVVADNGGGPTNTGTPSETGTTPPKSNPEPGAPAQSPIMFVTPVPGDTWQIGMQNPIQWTKEAGVNAEIDLLDATSLKLVGVILNVAGPHQTSYNWNTRDLLQSSTSPSKITVTPGRYVVRITFSGNNLSPITSQPLTLTQ